MGRLDGLSAHCFGQFDSLSLKKFDRVFRSRSLAHFVEERHSKKKYAPGKDSGWSFADIYRKSRGAFDSAKNHKRQRRKRQSVTAKREKSQTPKFV